MDNVLLSLFGDDLCVYERKGNTNYHLVVLFIDYEQQEAPGNSNNIISRHEY